LAGDFVCPKNKDKKLVFIAGGIGITPFRSIIKYLLDIKEKRDIVLFFSNYTPADVVYKDIFDQGERQLGIKTIYTVTNDPYPADWRGERGFVDEQMIKRTVPDYKERTFYLSGSHAMVVAFDGILQKMGVKKRQIKKDFFPGWFNLSSVSRINLLLALECLASLWRVLCIYVMLSGRQKKGLEINLYYAKQKVGLYRRGNRFVGSNFVFCFW